MEDRHESPESSLEAARNSLQRRDLDGYFDALTDRAVRHLLSNSISICLSSFRPETQKFGYKASYGCPGILKKYEWRGPISYDETATPESWADAVARIAEPRKMAAELESLHRKNDSGSSFVWEWLDQVELYDVEINGGTATATAKWPQDTRRVRFEKDETGWRFDVYFQEPE